MNGCTENVGQGQYVPCDKPLVVEARRAHLAGSGVLCQEHLEAYHHKTLDELLGRQIVGKCDFCQAIGQIRERTEQFYPWDGSDTEGSVAQTRTVHECTDRAACANRRHENTAVLAGHDDTYCRGTGQGWGAQQ